MGLFEHFPYVNFHNLNLDWILKKIKELLTRMAAAEEKLEEHEERLDAAETMLENHESRLDAAETAITGLNTRVTAAEADIDQLQTDVSALDGRIDNIENSLDDLLDPSYLIRYDFATLDTNVPVTGDVSFSSSANWARVNADRSVDFSIDVGYTGDMSDPSTIIATVTLNTENLGGTIKNLFYQYPMYATSIALGNDPGIVGAAVLNPTTHAIQFTVADDQDINISGRFFLN